MKRPEGFDRRAPSVEVEVASAADRRGAPTRPPRQASGSAPEPRDENRETRRPRRADPPLTDESTPKAPDARRAARAARRAARARRRYEKNEVRRFTRRSRLRRIGLLVAGGLVVAMATLVAVAVYSPLLALRTITIEGTSRISPVELHSAVDGQLGTPLALLDYGRLTRELGAFPLIRSYVTEIVPPNTLVVNIVERQPIASLSSATGFSLVDPAGVVIEQSVARIPGVPLVDIAGADASSPAFGAAIEVLLALPDSVLTQLDTVSARTRDDVRLTLAGGGAQIVWGGADKSDYKARVLAAALAQNYPNVSEYNVSAPGQLTYR